MPPFGIGTDPGTFYMAEDFLAEDPFGRQGDLLIQDRHKVPFRVGLLRRKAACGADKPRREIRLRLAAVEHAQKIQRELFVAAKVHPGGEAERVCDGLRRAVAVLADLGRVKIEFRAALGADQPRAAPPRAFFDGKIWL